jgi:hypothetical protein
MNALDTSPAHNPPYVYRAGRCRPRSLVADRVLDPPRRQPRDRTAFLVGLIVGLFLTAAVLLALPSL